ncbi:MAG: CpaD family pilus assembly protein [Hyphomicrobiaceae bacterium]|nr:CpaD family pilus assembly protein [Hyphomicrobiaceae bacterium]
MTKTPISLRTGALLSIVLATVPLLVSCSELQHLSSEDALVETTPAIGHPIAFVDRNEVLDVELPPHHNRLSRGQWADVYRFGLRFRNESTGPITIAQSGRHPAIADIREALHAAGVEPGRIRGHGRTTRHVVTLSYDRPLTVAPQCGHWYRDVGRERERTPHPDFGCSTQRNLAGMVANPRDLMGAQPETPASSERRNRVWSKYVSGDGAPAPTSSSGDTATDSKPKAAKK